MTTSNMTPRTDAEACPYEDLPSEPLDGPTDDMIVPAKFAKKLELELAAMTEERDYLSASIPGYEMTIQKARDERDKLQAEAEEFRETIRKREQELLSACAEYDETVARLTAELDAAKTRAENISREEANELQSILRTLTNSGTALKTSARELVRLYEETKSELDAARKERDDYKAITEGVPGGLLAKALAELDTAQARNADLERAIQEAPHGRHCAATFPAAFRGDCDCWKSRISPQAEQKLSNDSSGVEGHAGEQKCDDPTAPQSEQPHVSTERVEIPSNAPSSVTEPSENQASPAITSLPSPDHGKAGELECAKCTLCAKVPSSGFFIGCMIQDIPPEAGVNFGGWSCDGQGNLTRLLPAPPTTKSEGRPDLSQLDLSKAGLYQTTLADAPCTQCGKPRSHHGIHSTTHTLCDACSAQKSE